MTESDIVEVHCCVVTMKGKLVSFKHSINFSRVQDVLIRRSVDLFFRKVAKLIKCDSLKGVCRSEESVNKLRRCADR